MSPAVLRFAVVYVLLLVLLSLTVASSFVPLGGFQPVVSIAIALAKASLIFWFYMHLREESALVRLVAVGAAAWLIILLMLSWTDYGTRGWF